MILCLINHDFRYELEKLIRIFLPFEKLEFSDSIVITENSAVTQVNRAKEGNTVKAELYLADKSFEKSIRFNSDTGDFNELAELYLAQCLYQCFVEATGYKPQWGILTGVRPAKLYSRLSKKMGEVGADEYFQKSLMVCDKKLMLCKEAVNGENKITELSKNQSFSLYISVPFCPSRCSYCSFVSHSVEKAKKLIPEYLELLCRELEVTGEMSKKRGLILETVYIGGGTPTSLSAQQLEKVMQTVKSSFDLSHLREYTVEAGRPDTITKEKLIAIKNGCATRISINPQTMNDGVLYAIGRQHTSKQTEDAFELAREVGFVNINMDLIAGLPTDTLESFKATILKVLELNPESVTVHSLSMKRSSTLNVKKDFPEIEIGRVASNMVDFAHKTLSERGIVPYYMYRQSKTVGNLENVGYSKKGYECLYNVYIMDETHTILACGASAVTKLRQPDGDYIERIFNFKYPYEYIDRFDQIISRKKGIESFYDKYGG